MGILGEQWFGRPDLHPVVRQYDAVAPRVVTRFAKAPGCASDSKSGAPLQWLDESGSANVVGHEYNGLYGGGLLSMRPAKHVSVLRHERLTVLLADAICADPARLSAADLWKVLGMRLDGIAVVKVRKGGLAALGGIEAGMDICTVDLEPVSSAEEIRAALGQSLLHQEEWCHITAWITAQVSAVWAPQDERDDVIRAAETWARVATGAPGPVRLRDEAGAALQELSFECVEDGARYFAEVDWSIQQPAADDDDDGEGADAADSLLRGALTTWPDSLSFDTPEQPLIEGPEQPLQPDAALLVPFAPRQVVLSRRAWAAAASKLDGHPPAEDEDAECRGHAKSPRRRVPKPPPGPPPRPPPPPWPGPATGQGLKRQRDAPGHPGESLMIEGQLVEVTGLRSNRQFNGVLAQVTRRVRLREGGTGVLLRPLHPVCNFPTQAFGPENLARPRRKHRRLHRLRNTVQSRWKPPPPPGVPPQLAKRSQPPPPPGPPPGYAERQSKRHRSAQ
eukprot:TRINITY_DN14776_c0_g1_i1.p1 TRINITY_DN14776_c0_g1~~TRINITY_DN14776_c0_g1_i1.p1  ORF type:complete len:506 (+),score=142.80 TRINITY_DN14776_c0_g1_i1:1342-2859(+)